MNNSVKIILAVVTFVVCAALGYLVVPSKKTKSDVTITGVNGGSDGSGGGPSQTPNDDEESESDEEIVNNPQDSVEIAVDADSVKVDIPSEPETAPVNLDAVPEIKSVAVEQRNSKNYKKIGLAFTAKAVVASGDKLRYELYEIGETTAKYTSDNGSFKEVYPVDGGKYLLKVVNTKTGDFAERQVAGFDKIDKYTPAKLQEQLNSETTERLFYFHFDEGKLKFGCEGIDSSEVPTSLNALLSSRVANGWVLTVVGTPQYDKYNRITYFKVRITE